MRRFALGYPIDSAPQMDLFVCARQMYVVTVAIARCYVYVVIARKLSLKYRHWKNIKEERTALLSEFGIIRTHTQNELRRINR